MKSSKLTLAVLCLQLYRIFLHLISEYEINIDGTVVVKIITQNWYNFNSVFIWSLKSFYFVFKILNGKIECKLQGVCVCILWSVQIFIRKILDYF